MLAYQWACEFGRAGNSVSVVAPKGSTFPPELNIELIPTELREGDGAAYGRYRERLLKGEWDAVFDNSWQFFTILAQMEADHQLPVIHCYHSDPTGLPAAPPIQNPCMVAFSEAQANIIRSKWRCAVQVVHHGIDLDFYKPDPTIKRGDRYLFMARYCPEKGFLEIAYLAKKCRVPLDAYGDTEIIGPNQDYMRRCFEQADGRSIRVNPGIGRVEVAKQFQTHRALITWPNYVEIFGLTTVEAQACGCPVISKDSGAARELIVNGKTGWVVNTLEEAEELLNSNAAADLKPEDCRAQAMKFSIERSAERHLKLLKAVGEEHVYW